MGKRWKKQFSCNLSPQMYEWLVEYCKKESIPRGVFIEEVLKSYRDNLEKERVSHSQKNNTLVPERRKRRDSLRNRKYGSLLASPKKIIEELNEKLSIEMEELCEESAEKYAKNLEELRNIVKSGKWSDPLKDDEN